MTVLVEFPIIRVEDRIRKFFHDVQNTSFQKGQSIENKA